MPRDFLAVRTCGHVCLMIIQMFRTASAGQEPTLWLAPTYGLLLPSGHVFTPSDFMDIGEIAAWKTVAANTQVFKTYAAFLKRAPDIDVIELLKSLKRLHLKFAVEFGPLTPGINCGAGVEGYDGAPSARYIARRVKSLGGTIDLVAMDEPYWFARLSPKPRACHWPIRMIAENAARNMRAFQDVFPEIRIGDIEPVCEIADVNLPAELGQWTSRFEMEFGSPLAFFHADVLWSRNWRNALTGTSSMMHHLHIPFGVIVTGESQSRSNIDWSVSFRDRWRHSGDPGVDADQLVFQSWSKFPTKILPETDALSLTGLMLNYLETNEIPGVSVEVRQSQKRP